MGSFDFVTIFFLVAAVVIFLQLRSVLGRRTGSERPPFDPYTKRETVETADSADRGKVLDPRAFLMTTTTRICPSQIRPTRRPTNWSRSRTRSCARKPAFCT